MSKALDPLTRSHKKHVAAIRHNFARSILELQDQHRSAGISDPKGLAALSRSCSKYARREAVNRASDLSKEVRGYRRQEMIHTTSSVIDSVLEILNDDDNSEAFAQEQPLRFPCRRPSLYSNQ